MAGYIDEQGKAAIILINKWDAVEGDRHHVRIQPAGAGGAGYGLRPILYISALTGQRTTRSWARCGRPILGVAHHHEALNDVLADAQAALSPPPPAGGG